MEICVTAYVKRSFTRHKVPLYFWWIKPILKLSIIPKYCTGDCLKVFPLLFAIFKKIQVSEHRPILTQFRKFKKSRYQILRKGVFLPTILCKIYLEKLWNQSKLEKTKKNFCLLWRNFLMPSNFEIYSIFLNFPRS